MRALAANYNEALTTSLASVKAQAAAARQRVVRASRGIRRHVRIETP